MGKFLKDLAFGEMWQVAAHELVGGSIIPAPKGCFKPYDFISDGVKYEVKADRLAYKYGCKTMFIEFECSGKPSGISTTEAEYLIYFMVFPNNNYTVYKIPVTDLKMACYGCPVKNGGDGFRSRGYIVPVESFKTCVIGSEMSVEKQEPEMPLQVSP